MRVKICGVTSPQDADVAVRAGAHALGFIFYPKSPRCIAPESVRRIVDALPPFVERVGVFVHQSAEEIDRICDMCALSLAQVHFEMEDAAFESIRHRKIRVVRVREEADLQKHRGEFRLVDAWVEGYGGEGKRIAIEWLENADTENIVAAGGLNAMNIEELSDLGLWGVDANSGVESAPGVKDHAKVRAFLEKALRL